MALGDKVVVTVDAGGRSADEHTVVAGSVGGTVTWEDEGGFVVVREQTKRGRVIARHAFSTPRVISVVEKPKG